MIEEDSFFNRLPCLAVYFGNKKYNTIFKMPSVLLSEYLAADLSGVDPWAEEIVIYTPKYDEQILLADIANCRALETFLKMCGIDYRVEEKVNVEFMSPAGKIPFIACGSFILPDIERIVSFFKEKGHTIGDHLTEEKDKSDMRSFLSPIKILVQAELYYCWEYEKMYSHVTKHRYGSVFPFPLNIILPWMKRREVLAELAVFQWKKKTLNEVFKEVNRCLRTFSDQLGDNIWLFGEKPTQVDALLYGHLFAMLASNLSNEHFSKSVYKYPNLVSFYERIQKEYFDQSPP